MKILLTHRYFWPDTPPYAAILRSIGEDLAAAGHEVHVFASSPSYRDARRTAPVRERLGQLDVRRVRVLPEGGRNPVVRLINAAVYTVALFFTVLRLRPDVVTASSFPPVVAAWAASLGARITGARFVYHIMDVHPEVSRHAGGRMGRGWLFRLLTWLDQASLGRAAAAVVLSEDMAATLRARPGGARCPIEVINNFALEAFETAEPPPAELVKAAGRIRAIFAGNLGRFQNLELLAEGVARLFPEQPALELMFLGDGLALDGLRARWSDHPQVCFGPFLPFAQARELIRESDIGLVSLSPEIYRVALPSKALTYLGLGVPLLALVEPESALAREVVSHGLGVVPDAAKAAAIAEALRPLLSDPDALAAARTRVAEYYPRHASAEVQLSRWRALMARLGR